MAIDRIKFQDLVVSQLPTYVQEDFPLLGEFLEEYYKSQEIDGGTYDLIQNIDQYVKVDELYNLQDILGFKTSPKNQNLALKGLNLLVYHPLKQDVQYT